MARRARVGKKRGFTLIELLIVIFILTMLMAVALPLYLGAISTSERTTCRANMQTIASADQAFRARNHPSYTYTTVLSDLNDDLGATPTCPRGGTYNILISDGTLTASNGAAVPFGGLVIQCTSPGHGIFAPGIDSE